MGHESELLLDPSIRNWVLLPILVVMILVGLVRHYITLLFASPPKFDERGFRENQALTKGRILRSNGNYIPYSSFCSRRENLGERYLNGDFLKNPNASGIEGMGDPANMEVMMDGMKKNMAMVIPQTLIFGWVTFFFSGFVLTKLPFPLTIRFKAMLQRGIETPDMDVTWVSSLSWYFLNLFGLKSVFSWILGDGNAADSMKDLQQMQGMGMGQQPMGPQQDMKKIFKTEKENLDLFQHNWALKDVEQKLLQQR